MEVGTDEQDEDEAEQMDVPGTAPVVCLHEAVEGR